MIQTQMSRTRSTNSPARWLFVPILSLSTAMGCGIYGPPAGPAVENAVTIRFDGGEGFGSGTTNFSFMGANFTGGTIRTLGDPDLYGSGLFAYEVSPSSAVNITFDSPVDLLQLFFVKRGAGSTLLSAFDAQDNIVGTATASQDTAGGSVQTVSLSGTVSRIEVVHTGDGDGWIDNFTFRAAP